MSTPGLGWHAVLLIFGREGGRLTLKLASSEEPGATELQAAVMAHCQAVGWDSYDMTSLVVCEDEALARALYDSLDGKKMTDEVNQKIVDNLKRNPALSDVVNMRPQLH